MNENDIQKLAQYHGIDSLYQTGVMDFANELYQLGRKHGAGFEREECAKIAEKKVSKTWSSPQSPKEWWELACQTIAIEIRERNKKT